MRRLLVAAAALLLGLSFAASPASAVSETYVIGPEDVIEVQVWDNKDLNQVGFVRPDGKISLPLAGELQVAARPSSSSRMSWSRPTRRRSRAQSSPC